MSELRDLYQELILDHYRSPRNFRELEGTATRAEGFNPLCGDRVTVYIVVEGDVAADIAFQGSGCAICMASSSVMTEVLKGQSIDDIEAIFGKFHDLVTAEPDAEPETSGLGKLAAFGGVREYPVRVKCATLPWHTLQAALENKGETVTTE